MSVLFAVLVCHFKHDATWGFSLRVEAGHWHVDLVVCSIIERDFGFRVEGAMVRLVFGSDRRPHEHVGVVLLLISVRE